MANDIPKHEHFAIIIEKSETIYRPGDQRSRDAPGHGYPAEYQTINSSEYIAFSLDKEHDFKERIAQLTKTGTRFHALRVQPLTVKIATVVSF